MITTSKLREDPYYQVGASDKKLMRTNYLFDGNGRHIRTLKV